jgi:hypothetical protein
MEELKMATYRESLKNIQKQVNKELSIEDRMELIHQLLPSDKFVFGENEDFKAILEFISSERFRKQNGHKKKKIDPQYEDTFLAISLSYISDYLLDKWGEWKGRNNYYENINLEDYQIQSRYDLERLLKAGNKKSNVGFDTSVADDFLENSVSQNVLQGWEFHVDQLEKLTKRANDIFNFSEDAKREMRNKLIMDKLNNPTLRERYIAYKEMGLRYGFDKDLTVEQKLQMKKQWIEFFQKEKGHPVKLKDRYYRLLKDFNDIGYELSIILQQLSKEVKPRQNNQPTQRPQTVEDNAGAFVLGIVNLGIREHVMGLLSIQKGKKVGEYYPLFMMIKEKYQSEDSPFGILESEWNEVLEIADLTDMERDIVFLIIGRQKEFNIYDKGNQNPYEYIAEYINEKYHQKKTKTDIVKMVEKHISKVIANTYEDLEKGLDSKKCTCCKNEKLASTHNFSEDDRKKDGLKSICKKCVAKKAKLRKQIV